MAPFDGGSGAQDTWGQGRGEGGQAYGVRAQMPCPDQHRGEQALPARPTGYHVHAAGRARGWLPKAGAVQIATLFASSAALGLIGLAPSLAAALALALLAGLISGVCGGLAYALVQTAPAPAFLGRVTSVMSLTSFGLAPLAYPAVRCRCLRVGARSGLPGGGGLRSDRRHRRPGRARRPRR